MKRLLTGLFLVPVLGLAAGLTGCGKEDKPAPRPTRITATDGGGKEGGGAPKKTIKAGTAKITGRMLIEGAAPQGASLVPAMEAHNDKQYCLAGKDFEKQDQTWMVSKDGAVENVAIWINPPAGSEFEPGEAKGDAEMDQPHCVYIPHVVIVKPGQKLLIKNSAPMAHNTKLDVDREFNDPFGQTIPPKGEAPVKLKPQGDKPITAACDFHGWMKAKIWVMPHPYVARTGADGTFTIENVPEGEVSIVAWHESAGFFHGGKKGTKHTVTAGENKLGDLKVPAGK